MELRLTIEPQQRESLHWTAEDALYIAAGAESLQDAADILTARLNAHAWSIYRGGSHIAIHWGKGAGSIRVAMIAEVR